MVGLVCGILGFAVAEAGSYGSIALYFTGVGSAVVAYLTIMALKGVK